jgi:methyl-accepting chemotaxis protein
MGTEIYLSVTRGTRDRIDMMALFGKELAADNYAGIKYPMSIGDSDGIEKELLDVREKTKGVEMVLQKKVLGSMIIKMSTDRIYATIISARNRSVMITVFGIGVIIVLTYAMLTKLVSRPVESLAEKSKRFAEGDMSVSADVKTENEIGVLGNSFNYMVKSIKDQIEYAK